jgi:pimeloyl-ACP methyl ester carboxylesterase
MSVRASISGVESANWHDHIWWSGDGVRLHVRIYPGDSDALPVICLPGLTRNARDFDGLAPALAGKHMVYAVNLRGRGESGYAKDSLTYVPLTYAQDVAALLADRQIDRFVSIGTSLGGIVTMLLAAMLPGKLAGAVFNDVGPEIGADGLARIRAYVGQNVNHPTWMHAARASEATNRDVYPHWGIEDWLVFAKRTHRLTPEGRIVADYDANIAQPFRVPGGETGGDLWPAFAALKAVPTLIIRGENSDILAPETAQRMLAALDRGRLVTVSDTGHAPTLDEPEVRAAIADHLASLPA